MATHIYIVETPDQLLALYALRKDGNRMIENLARVWRSEIASGRTPPPINWARVEFETSGRKCRVFKRFGQKGDGIGMLPYNKALAYCREKLKPYKETRRR